MPTDKRPGAAKGGPGKGSKGSDGPPFTADFYVLCDFCSVQSWCKYPPWRFPQLREKICKKRWQWIAWNQQAGVQIPSWGNQSQVDGNSPLQRFVKSNRDSREGLKKTTWKEMSYKVKGVILDTIWRGYTKDKDHFFIGRSRNFRVVGIRTLGTMLELHEGLL